MILAINAVLNGLWWGYLAGTLVGTWRFTWRWVLGIALARVYLALGVAVWEQLTWCLV